MGLVEAAVDERGLGVVAEAQVLHVRLPVLPPFDHALRQLILLSLTAAIIIARLVKMRLALKFGAILLKLALEICVPLLVFQEVQRHRENRDDIKH